ncbi:uncharacterized protein LOC105174116 isoform X1 [Sesamum indicum]|uniref:Uncharacterized protein LOC105174116 isoform X1 n=1 Tax=Sesamum indicum TaxID=4182 RepID=A0A6I9U9K3_SESIN|nr:uncharacterized protein LOC105174116 isoform X1 [Sesamum indicum]XP_020553623.1 uncharacterized protein LOC105174116 isoform X1 [Sesamum indicum]XP_020553624.1 uncharacterized protein LOC105174116 isoform X1 [Sesamum indicum]
MKQVSHAAAIICVFLLLIIPHTSARLLLSHQGDDDSAGMSLQQQEDFSTLMGLEESCGDGDEGCEKRRMVSIAVGAVGVAMHMKLQVFVLRLKFR